MRSKLFVCQFFLCCLSSVLAQNKEHTPDTLNTVWQMKYGTLAENHTHAITRISPDALCPAGNGFLTNALYGMVPGALIQNTGFQPGTPPSVRIRGNHSPGIEPVLTLGVFKWYYAPATNEPVYFVDGMQVDAQWFSGLNLDEIESVEVIRNLAGTIGYGQSGINGVIQVKTKRPQKQGVSIVYDGYFGLQKQTNIARQMNGAEWADYIREAYRNTEPPSYYLPTPSLSEDMKILAFTSDPDIWESLQMGYDSNGAYHPAKVRSTDWTDLVSQTGSIYEQSLTLLHGTEKMRFTASANYFSNTGTVKGTGYDRYSARMRAECDFTRWFSAGAQLWGSYSEQRLKDKMYFDAYTINPLAIPYEKDGTLKNFLTENIYTNPLLYLDDYKEKAISNIFSGRLYASLHPIEGFDLQMVFLPQITKPRQQIDCITPFFFQDNEQMLTSVEGSRKISTWELSMSYKKRIQQHVLGGAVSGSLRKDIMNYDYKGITERSGVEWSSWGGGGEVASEYHNFFIELFYRLDDQLFINFLARMGKEGSSRIYPGMRSTGFNPSISAAYHFFSTEDRSNRILNQLYLRTNFGKDNNIQQISFPIPIVHDTWIFLVKDIYYEWNIGLDHAWFQNRLKGSIDYYIRKNHVSYYDVKKPLDFLDMKNSGVEISLSGVHIHSGNWRWTSSLMVSIEKEKVKLLDGNSFYPYIDYNGTIANEYPLHSYFYYRYDRLWQDTPSDKALMEKYHPKLRPGDIKVADTNGDDQLDWNDMTYLGSPSPKWYGSFYNSVCYRNFELSFLLYTRQKFMLDNDYFSPETYTNSQKIDYWTPTNTGAYYPRPMSSASYNNYSGALRLEDASFVRLQYVSLSWSLPQKWISLLRVSQLKVYATVQNPALFTKFSQSDPEGAATMGSVPGHITGILGVKLAL